MATCKVLGGDIPNYAKYNSMLNIHQFTWLPKGTFNPFKSASLQLDNNIIDLEEITEENKHKILAKAGWSTLGAIALGPVGLLAGLFMGGKKKMICAAIKCKSGESILVECENKVYQELYAIYQKTEKTVSEEPTQKPSIPSMTFDQLQSLKADGIISEEEYKEKARKLFEQQ